MAAPSAAADIARKDTVDAASAALNSALSTHAALTAANTHGAVAAATANRLIIRDANGRAKVAEPSAAADIATKGYVDGKVPSVGAAPLPKEGSGVGQWTSADSRDAAHIKVPSGGTWAYFKVATGALSGSAAGIVAGGTTLIGNSGSSSFLFWRIA